MANTLETYPPPFQTPTESATVAPNSLAKIGGKILIVVLAVVVLRALFGGKKKGK